MSKEKEAQQLVSKAIWAVISPKNSRLPKLVRPQLALSMQIVPHEGLCTANRAVAFTDGVRIFYNPELVLGYSFYEVAMLLAEELIHAQFLHPWRSVPLIRNERIPNSICQYAADQVVANALQSVGLRPISLYHTLETRWENYSFEAIARLVWAEHLQQCDRCRRKMFGDRSSEEQGGEQPNPSGSGSSGDPQDQPGSSSQSDHSCEDHGHSKKQPQQAQGQDQRQGDGQGSGGGEDSTGTSKNGMSSFHEQICPCNEEMVVFAGIVPADESDPRSHEQQVRIQMYIRELIHNHGKGDLPLGLDRLARLIMFPTCRDLKAALAEFMVTSRGPDRADWRYPERRRTTATGFYWPERRSIRMGRVAVAIDTSGSIFPETLDKFYSAVQYILDEYEPEEMILYGCDADLHVKDVRIYPGDRIPKNWPGGGGTDFRPVFRAVDKLDEVTALIYLTDLMGSFPEKEPEYPVLWVVEDLMLQRLKPPFGRVVYV